MNATEFRRYLDRDRHCPCCGSTGPDLIPQHRVNRGMGGSKARHQPANVIVLCGVMNGLIESSAWHAQLARDMGWKLNSWENPVKYPFYDNVTLEWVLIDNYFGRRTVANPHGKSVAI